MEEIKIWGQMFFEDGSVTQGKRVPAFILDPENKHMINNLAEDLLKSVNREEGWLLLWGAGNIVMLHFPTFSSEESETLVLEP